MQWPSNRKNWLLSNVGINGIESNPSLNSAVCSIVGTYFKTACQIMLQHIVQNSISRFFES